MRPFPTVLSLAAPLLGLLVIGCGNKVTSPGLTFTQQTADDVAVQAAVSLTVVGGNVQLALGSTPSAPPASAREALPARAAWDTTATWNGITYEASRTFYDALDNELADYSLLAVRMRWASRAHGTYEGVRDTASVGHAATMDFRGIQVGQDTVRINGVCRDTLDNTFRSLDGVFVRHFLWIGSSAVDDVRILKSTLPSGGWPIGGSISYSVSVDRLRSNNLADVEVHFEAVVVVTFNGTNEPEIVVNGTYRYRWNMQTGQVTRA